MFKVTAKPKKHSETKVVKREYKHRTSTDGSSEEYVYEEVEKPGKYDVQVKFVNPLKKKKSGEREKEHRKKNSLDSNNSQEQKPQVEAKQKKSRTKHTRKEFSINASPQIQKKKGKSKNTEKLNPPVKAKPKKSYYADRPSSSESTGESSADQHSPRSFEEEQLSEDEVREATEKLETLAIGDNVKVVGSKDAQYTNIVYGDDMWVWLKNENVPKNYKQLIVTVKSQACPTDHVANLWKQELILKQIEYGDGLWVLVADNLTDFHFTTEKQSLNSSKEFPERIIKETWRNQGRIVYVSYCNYQWFVISEEESPYTVQQGVLIKTSLTGLIKQAKDISGLALCVTGIELGLQSPSRGTKIASNKYMEVEIGRPQKSKNVTRKAVG